MKNNGFKFQGLFLLASMAAILIAVSCKSHNQIADAYGNFESDEVTISAETQGSLLFLNLSEGDKLEKGQMVGLIDTTTAFIKRGQLIAQQALIKAQIENLEAQLKVQASQRENIVTEFNRVENLLKDNAATQQQYDDIKGKLDVLDSQTKALESQRDIIYGNQKVLMAQIRDADNLLSKCRIINPSNGTVLEKYVEPGELMVPGKPIYKIANLNEMELKVYISGAQLPSVAIGDSVSVAIDKGASELQTMPGKISWISSEVEFTPKIIQTKAERVNMVYALKVKVKNDGRLKIGMPGEVTFLKKPVND